MHAVLCPVCCCLQHELRPPQPRACPALCAHPHQPQQRRSKPGEICWCTYYVVQGQSGRHLAAAAASGFRLGRSQALRVCTWVGGVLWGQLHCHSLAPSGRSRVVCCYTWRNCGGGILSVILIALSLFTKVYPHKHALSKCCRVHHLLVALAVCSCPKVQWVCLTFRPPGLSYRSRDWQDPHP